jgi:Transglycosylase SLT domain
MTTPSKLQMLSQLHSLRQTGFDQKLEQHAQAHGISPHFFFAIASRETNCHNILGDSQHGEFHGVGIVQIDIQHPLARQARDDGSWKTNPDPLIDFGAQLLEDNINRAKQEFPNFNAQQQLKVAASGYNCGMGNAIAGANNGDSDAHTTGGDYGRDVMTRMAIFEELIAEGN